MTTNKRQQGREAVEQMLAHGMPVIIINQILSAMPAHPFTNGAYERLLDEQIKQREGSSHDNQ